MRINRLRRARGRGDLTGCQREILMRGQDFMGDGDGFESEAAERVAWQKHRVEMLAEAGPGRRPHAYYRLDLGVDPLRWYDEVAALLDHDLVNKADVLALERDYAILAPGQGPLYSAFDDAASIGRMGLDGYVLGGLAREFEVAARWHAWHGRQDVADRYKRRAQHIREFLEKKP